MAFFTPWQTWIKLTFVLGCAICVVLVYALGVRYSNKRQLKKHTIRIATETAERGEITESIRRSEEVPFGIRAIERGCMVEGVWNSKASTPLQTPISSKASSPILKGKNTLKKHNRDSSLSNVSHVDIPEPASVTTKLRETGAGFLNVALENLGTTSRNQIASGMMDVEREMPTRDDLADGPGPAIYRDQFATATTCDLPPFSSGSQPEPSMISNAADEFEEQFHPDGSTLQLSFTTRYIPGWAKRPSHTRFPLCGKEMQTLSLTPRIAHPSEGIEALEYMNAHRRSHAAETGQLIPRVRRKAGSGDFSAGPTTSVSESGKDYSSARSVSWPISTSASCDSRTKPTTPSLPPNLEDLPIRILAKKLPLPPLRHEELSAQVEFERAPSIPFAEDGVPRQPNWASLCVKDCVATSKPCPSAWRDRAHEQLEEIQLNVEGPVKVPLTDAVLSHHNTTTRQVNSGFEVLPAGRLTMPTVVKEWGDAPNVPVRTSNDTTVVGKLQKRARSQSRSRRLSLEHERQREENMR